METLIAWCYYRARQVGSLTWVKKEEEKKKRDRKKNERWAGIVTAPLCVIFFLKRPKGQFFFSFPYLNPLKKKMSAAVANDIPVKDNTVKKSQQKQRKRNKKKSSKQRQEEEAKRKAVSEILSRPFFLKKY